MQRPSCKRNCRYLRHCRCFSCRIRQVHATPLAVMRAFEEGDNFSRFKGGALKVIARSCVTSGGYAQTNKKCRSRPVPFTSGGRNYSTPKDNGAYFEASENRYVACLGTALARPFRRVLCIRLESTPLITIAPLAWCATAM